MNKVNVICLRCGTVQIRSDVLELLDDRYIVLNQKKTCPKCGIKTNHIATKDMKSLRKSLEADPSKKLDSYILKLVKR